MTRSIRWMSSSAPSSPFSMACVGLPQPRSRMALAAAIRAGAAALVLRMTPTSTLSAVRVWLRASERISVMDLGICHVRIGHKTFARPNAFARRGIGMIHGEIVRPNGRSRGAGKVHRQVSAVWTRDEWNDLCAHENPSHSAIATRPASASDIKYPVMPACSRRLAMPDSNQMRGMTASSGHFRREPYLSKGGRVPARSRAPAKAQIRARTAARVKAPCGKRFAGDWCAPRPPSDFGKFK